MKTNVTDSSRDCFHSKSFGLVRRDYCKEISGWMIMQMEPKTRREIGRELNLESNQYSGRCNDLIAAKVLTVVGTKKCPHSGRMVEALMHSANLNPQKNLFS